LNPVPTLFVGRLKLKNIAQDNFGAPKFGYPCSALCKPSDFLQILINVDFEPIVPMAAI